LKAKFQGKGKPFGRAEFDKILGHCAVVTDTPSNCFGPELIEAYPEAKVVLCERDFDAWMKSFNTVIEGSFGWKYTILGWTDPLWMGRLDRFISNWVPNQFHARTEEECRANARKVYEEHYSEIRRITPKKRLLEYRLGEGWEPLCRFLGKPIPDVPFPHINETEMLKEQLGLMASKALKRSARNVGLVVILLVVGGMTLRKLL